MSLYPALAPNRGGLPERTASATWPGEVSARLGVRLRPPCGKAYWRGVNSYRNLTDNPRHLTLPLWLDSRLFREAGSTGVGDLVNA